MRPFPATLLVCLFLLTSPVLAQWPQWGGPSRNFVITSARLGRTWPAGGPPVLWRRALGEGHSAVVADDGRLYTMYRPLGLLSLVRRSQEEVIVALDAATGNTLWEHWYPAPTAGLDFQEGAGPHVTPLVVVGRLFTASSRKELFALDTRSGKLLWSHDLSSEFGAPLFDRGYASSPIAFGEIVIVQVGGPQGAMAFDQATGHVVWRSPAFDDAPASPVLIDVEGQTQVVVFGANEVVGLDPASGGGLWSHPHRTNWGLNISTPVWGDDNLLLLSSAYNAGTRVLRLARSGDRTTAEERWYSNRMRVHIGSVVRIGDHAYGSSGDFGPAFLTAVNVKSGEEAWRDRSFARAQLLYAGDLLLVILDEDGTLGLATVSPQGLQVLARTQVLSSLAWTPPTLAGTRLYVRDRKEIVALDLGARGVRSHARSGDPR